MDTFAVIYRSLSNKPENQITSTHSNRQEKVKTVQWRNYIRWIGAERALSLTLKGQRQPKATKYLVTGLSTHVKLAIHAAVRFTTL